MVARRMLSLLHELDENIWQKVTFALTHFDHAPPGFEGMDDERRNTFLREKLAEWEECLQKEMKTLGVCEEVVENIQIAPTTHTEVKIELKYYGALFGEGITNWLENLWLKLIQNVIAYQSLALVDIKSLVFFVYFIDLAAQAPWKCLLKMSKTFSLKEQLVVCFWEVPLVVPLLVLVVELYRLSFLQN